MKASSIRGGDEGRTSWRATDAQYSQSLTNEIGTWRCIFVSLCMEPFPIMVALLGRIQQRSSMLLQS